MIRDKTSDVETLTTLGADRLKMGIDPDGMVHITDLLTNMYSDEELAVLREYSTNARDSHIAAGCPERPIEVTLPIGPYELPTGEDRGRFLRIRDYGVGLSAEEIAEVYSFYGKSTKNDSNEQGGMMGIGGKSGLVSTFGSFVLTAVKDGQKTVVAVGRNEATEPVMDLVSITETDEPNGVMVELPTPKHSSLRRKAEAFFQFWPEGSVLVDGKAPTRLAPKIEIAPTMWIVDGLYSKSQRIDFIVMANIPYPVQLDGKLADGHSLVIFVPTGSVNIAPSREALRMTQKTKDEIARLMAEYDQAVKTVIQNKVNAAKTKAEAVKVAMKWRSSFASKADLELKYKGQKMPMQLTVPASTAISGPAQAPLQSHKGILVTRHNSAKLSSHDRQEQIFIGTLIDSVLVHGYETHRKFVSVHKKKLEKWAEDKGLKPSHYVLTKSKLAHGWIDSSMRVDWETIKAVRVNTVKSKDGTPRPKGSYDMYLAGIYAPGTPADQIPTDQDIFWMEPDYLNLGGTHRRRTHRAIVFSQYPAATFVMLTANRINKFQRDFPQARHAREVVKEIFADFKKNVKLDDLRRLRAEYDISLLAKLDIDRIDDPKIREGIKFAKRPIDIGLRNRLEEIRSIIGSLVMNNDSELKTEWIDPLAAYPLASSYDLESTYEYINAVYAARERKKA